MEPATGLRKYYKLGLGYLIILIGIVGVFVPILPGTPFLVLGGTILIKHSPTAQRRWQWAELRFPHIFAFIKRRMTKRTPESKMSGTPPDQK